MRQSAATLSEFYKTALGRAAAARISRRLSDLWGNCEGERILGLGFANPVLPLWLSTTRSCVSLQPEQAGVEGLSSDRGDVAALSPEDRFPFADEQFDRIVLLHALEEAESPRAVLREAWRVLAPEGRIVIATANRRSFWSLAETKAFGHGRPWTRRQLIKFADDSLFQVTASSTAVHMPPLNWPFITSAAAAWERAGEVMLPSFGGVVLVEAVKRLYAKPGGSAAAVATHKVKVGNTAPSLPRNRAARDRSQAQSNSRIDGEQKDDTPKTD